MARELGRFQAGLVESTCERDLARESSLSSETLSRSLHASRHQPARSLASLASLFYQKEIPWPHHPRPRDSHSVDLTPPFSVAQTRYFIHTRIMRSGTYRPARAPRSLYFFELPTSLRFGPLNLSMTSYAVAHLLNPESGVVAQFVFLFLSIFRFFPNDCIFFFSHFYFQFEFERHICRSIYSKIHTRNILEKSLPNMRWKNERKSLSNISRNLSKG